LFQNETSLVPKRENYLNIQRTQKPPVRLGKKLGLAVLAFLSLYDTNSKAKFDIEPQVQTQNLNEIIKEYSSSTPLTIEEQAQRLNELHSYGITAEDLILYTRAIFTEAGSDSKAKTPEKLKTGWEAVAQVILNRYLLDKNNKTKLFSTETTLEGIINAPNQFHGVRDNPGLFRKKTFKNKDKYRVFTSSTNEKKLTEIYQVVIEVLEQKTQDITQGSLYFHTDWVKNGRKAGQKPFSLNGKRCVIKESIQYNTHLFFSTTCPIEPTGYIVQKEDSKKKYFN